MSRQLFVVSEDAEFRRRIALLCKGEGLATIEAESAEASTHLDGLAASSLIVIGPEVAGADLASAVVKIKQAIDEDTPMMVCGSEASADIEKLCREAGVDYFLPAGFHAEEFLARVRMILAMEGRAKGRVEGAEALQDDAVRTVKEMAGESRKRSRASVDRRRAIIDSNTGLPQTTALFREVKNILNYTGQMTVLYVCCPNNSLIEETFGWETASGVLRDIGECLDEILPDLAADPLRSLVAYAGGDDFVLFLGGERGEMAELLDSRHAALLARRISELVDERWRPEVGQIFDVAIGSSSVRINPRVHVERLIYRTINAARSEMDQHVRTGHRRKVELLRRCIRERALHLVFQPIVSSNQRVLGYEALTRGRIRGLENPQILFDVAQSVGMVWDISREVRRLAFHDLLNLPEGQLLFVNLHPIDFGDPDLVRLSATATQQASEAAARRVVFEVTERAAIEDFDRFRASIAPLRSLGYRIAVDDLGSGYSGLNSIANIEPNFIKFDISLIRNIDKNPLRQNLIRTFVKFAESIPSEVIAEGVETEAERDCCIDLGCHFLQGYLFARPGPPFPSIQA